MSIQEEVTRLTNAKEILFNKALELGLKVNRAYKIDVLADIIRTYEPPVGQGELIGFYVNDVYWRDALKGMSWEEYASNDGLDGNMTVDGDYMVDGDGKYLYYSDLLDKNRVVRPYDLIVPNKDYITK
jgi:hypothetical protein